MYFLKILFRETERGRKRERVQAGGRAEVEGDRES